jgi:hypothetical protein
MLPFDCHHIHRPKHVVVGAEWSGNSTPLLLARRTYTMLDVRLTVLLQFKGALKEVHLPLPQPGRRMGGKLLTLPQAPDTLLRSTSYPEVQYKSACAMTQAQGNVEFMMMPVHR